MFFDIEDWDLFYGDLSARNGWKVSDFGARGKPELMIEASTPAISDEQAVQILMRAYLDREPHAIATYELIKHTNLQEFKHWGMDSWPK